MFLHCSYMPGCVCNVTTVEAEGAGWWLDWPAENVGYKTESVYPEQQAACECHLLFVCEVLFASWLIIGYNLTQTCRFFVTKDCQILFLKKCLSSQHPVYAPITSSCPSVKFMSDIFHPSSVDEWSDMPLCEPISCECDLNLVTMYTCMLQPPWAFHWCFIQTQVMDRCWDIGWNRRTLAINMLMEGCSL